MTDFDITKMVPRFGEKPKPKARIDPVFADFSQWSKNAIRKHYPELAHKNNTDTREAQCFSAER